MPERSLKNAFGKIYQRTGFKQNAYFRITDLLGDKPSRALDTVLLKTGQKDDFDPRATARARTAYRLFSLQLKNSLKLKSLGGATNATQKLLLAKALKGFLVAAKGRKISKTLFDHVHEDFKRIGELYNNPETDAEKKERKKKEGEEKIKKPGEAKKISTAKEEIKKIKKEEPAQLTKPITDKTEKEIEAEIIAAEDEIEQIGEEIAIEVKEQLEEIEIPTEVVVSLQPESNEDRGAFSRRITESLLQGKISNLADLKNLKDNNLKGLLTTIAVSVKKGGNADLANQIAAQIDDPKHQKFVLNLISNAKPDSEKTNVPTPTQATPTTPTATAPAPQEESPIINEQVKGIKENVKKPDGGEIDDQTADKIRTKIDGWNKSDGQDHFKNPDKIKQAGREVEIENGQNKQIKDTLQKQGISVDDGMTEEIRKKIDGWNRTDGKNYFNDENQINEAHKQVAPTHQTQQADTSPALPATTPSEKPNLPPASSQPAPSTTTPDIAETSDSPTPKFSENTTPPVLPAEAQRPNITQPETTTPASPSEEVGTSGSPTVEAPATETTEPSLPNEPPPTNEQTPDQGAGENLPQLPQPEAPTDSTQRPMGMNGESEKDGWSRGVYKKGEKLKKSDTYKNELLGKQIDKNNTPPTLAPEDQTDAASSIDAERAKTTKNENQSEPTETGEPNTDSRANEENGAAPQSEEVPPAGLDQTQKKTTNSKSGRPLKEINEDIRKTKIALEKAKKKYRMSLRQSLYCCSCCSSCVIIVPPILYLVYRLILIVKPENTECRNLRKKIKELQAELPQKTTS